MNSEILKNVIARKVENVVREKIVSRFRSVDIRNPNTSSHRSPAPPDVSDKNNFGWGTRLGRENSNWTVVGQEEGVRQIVKPD